MQLVARALRRPRWSSLGACSYMQDPNMQPQDASQPCDAYFETGEAFYSRASTLSVLQVSPSSSVSALSSSSIVRSSAVACVMYPLTRQQLLALEQLFKSLSCGFSVPGLGKRIIHMKRSACMLHPSQSLESGWQRSNSTNHTSLSERPGNLYKGFPKL
jgi:hypothetical protein